MSYTDGQVLTAEELNASFAAAAGTGVTVITQQTGPFAEISAMPGQSGVLIPAGTTNVPANALGINGRLEIKYLLYTNNSSGVKTLVFKLGGQQVGPSINVTTSESSSGTIIVQNNNSQTAQICSSESADGVLSSGAFPTATVNTAIAQQLTAYLTVNNTTDTIQLASLIVTAYNPPYIAVPTPLKAGAQCFYGINSHFDSQIPATGSNQAETIANTISIMKAVGMKVLRLSWEGPTDTNGFGLTSLQSLVDYAAAFVTDGTGLMLYVCADISMESTPGTAYTSEAAAYSANFTYGAQVATALLPYASNVMAIECGNELDAASAGGVSIRTLSGVAGSLPSDFSETVWPLFRGASGGCMAGIRSVTTAIPCASNAFTVTSIAASDMLWNGTNPNGTTGSNVVRWDITAWHIYGVDGFAAGFDGSDATPGQDAPAINLWSYLYNAYGKPLVISEWNPGQEGTSDSANAAAATTYLTAWYAARYTYNIASLIFYSLGDPGYEIVPTGAAPYTLNGTGVALQTFIAANPVTQ